MAKRAQTRARWLAVLACAIVALLPESGLALCFGHDGHLGLGAATVRADDCPCEHASDASDVKAPPGDRHPPCDDLSLAQPQVGAPQENAGAPAAPPSWPAPCTTGALDRPLLPAASPWRRPPNAGPPGSTMRQRRTVVLLI